MAFLKQSCNIVSCQHHVQQKGTEGYCDKPPFTTCPQTTKAGNETVKDYHKNRQDKYKKYK
jgi:hypothetical protein